MCAYFSISTPQPTTPSLQHCRSGAHWCKGEGQYAPTGRTMPIQGTGRPDETRAHNLMVHPAPHGRMRRYSRRFATIVTIATIPQRLVQQLPQRHAQSISYHFAIRSSKAATRSTLKVRGDGGLDDTALLTKKNPDFPVDPATSQKVVLSIDLFDSNALRVKPLSTSQIQAHSQLSFPAWPLPPRQEERGADPPHEKEGRGSRRNVRV